MVILLNSKYENALWGTTKMGLIRMNGIKHVSDNNVRGNE